MKDMNMIVWLTQLGISVAVPLAGFVVGAVWLRNHFELGMWIIWVGVILGGICAVNGFRHSLRMMEYMAKDKTKKKQEPPIGFNEHN